MTRYIYALGDADSVRKKLQGYLLSGDLDALGRFSTALTEGIKELARLAQESMKADVIFCGGDDILLRFDAVDFSAERLDEIKSCFEESTETTISFGVGASIEEAFLNLARAKSMEPGTVLLSGGIDANSDVKRTPDGAA